MQPSAFLTERKQSLGGCLRNDDEVDPFLQMESRAIQLIEKRSARRTGTFVEGQMGGFTADRPGPVIAWVAGEHEIVDGQ
jgi:hypothetical protein